jgi:mRNA interferase MazF
MGRRSFIMTMQQPFPQQGTVYLCRALRQSGDTKKRPVVVVSINARNQYSSTVLIVPFSSDVAISEGNPCRVLVTAGEGGLEKNSVALCDVISSIEKRYLEQGPYGQISDRTFVKIQAAIQISIGLF